MRIFAAIDQSDICVNQAEREQSTKHKENTQPSAKRTLNQAQREQSTKSKENTQPIKHKENTQPIKHKENTQPIKHKENTQPIKHKENTQPSAKRTRGEERSKLLMVGREEISCRRRASSDWKKISAIDLRRGPVGSASACCKAGPSSILGSAPQGGLFPTEHTSDEEMERGLSEWRWINVL